MGLTDVLFSTFLNHPFLCLVFTPVLFLLVRGIYRVTLHPLAHIPGPLLWKLSSLPLHFHAYTGDEATVIHALHSTYGPLLRVSPSEVDISDADALMPIYTSRGGFLKASCYSNFDIDGHATIFSELSPSKRAIRAKAVVSMFSTKSIRENEAKLYGCVDTFVERMREEARGGGRVDVLNMARSLAIDAVSTHLFQENYGGTGEKGKTLSVSAFVDAFVAVGRFFYLPNWAFVWLEWGSEKVWPDEHTAMSMGVVDAFVDQLVEGMEKGAQNYPGRLMAAGLEKSEVKAQCKDLMFAGTDSTGMNLATICRLLVLHPEKYQILRKELLANATNRQDIQSLPYLTGVIKEGLRLSMANPTRLPHIVPASGWDFKSTHFPPGTLVGCSATELHYNATAYPNSHAFQPERWLEENVTAEASKYFFAFGAGARACIARNLASVELYMAVERLVEGDVLRGARTVGEVEIFEWFNSRVKGEKIELTWAKDCQ